MKDIDKNDHTFPTEEIRLFETLYAENKIDKYDLDILHTLLHKYLSLRSDVFHEEIESDIEVRNE